MEDRRYCDPLVVYKDGGTRGLRRVPFTERTLQEGWLQDLLERHPELLPIEDIEPAFAPLVSIGREVGTTAGAIDNLFINPDGYLTLVETKLWRNPEARREVVGQIIDYAKDVSQWDFEDLDAQVRAYARQHSQGKVGLLEIVRDAGFGFELDEAQFIDRVTRNLQRGRLLLIVAGDGIRESVEAMADYLQQTPQLHFTLALVELLTYELDASERSLLVVPQVVARTREITRAVVRVEGTGIESVHVDVDTTTEMVHPRSKRYTLTEEDFFDRLGQAATDEEVRLARTLVSDMENLGAKIDWKQASFSVKLPDPGESGQMLTLLVVQTSGEAYVGWLPDQLRRVGLPEKIGLEYFEKSASLLGTRTARKGESLSWKTPQRLSKIGSSYDAFSGLLADTIERIKRSTLAETS